MNQQPRDFHDPQQRSVAANTISKKLFQSLTLGVDYDMELSEPNHGTKAIKQDHLGGSQKNSTSSTTNQPLTTEIEKSPSTDTPTTGLIDQIQALNNQIQQCQLCGLCLTRTNSVPGMGSFEPLVMIIGEGPGAEEDRQGLPFVGKAGQYLDEWLRALGLSRQETVYITNIVKCRPPANRDPHPEEIKSCSLYLEKQIELLKPRAILSLGRVSAGFLLGGAHRMEDIHGKMFEYRGVPVFPTYHPAAVLRNQDLRRPVWEDLKHMHQFLYVQGLVSELPQRKKE